VKCTKILGKRQMRRKEREREGGREGGRERVEVENLRGKWGKKRAVMMTTAINDTRVSGMYKCT
jgi:hypothetical protein